MAERDSLLRVVVKCRVLHRGSSKGTNEGTKEGKAGVGVENVLDQEGLQGREERSRKEWSRRGRKKALVCFLDCKNKVKGRENSGEGGNEVGLGRI